jgi:hypothetical protein
MISCNVRGINLRTSESLWNEAPHVRDLLAVRQQVSQTPLGKVTRRETAAAGLNNASIGKDRWIGGYGTSLRGRPYRRPKNRGDQVTRPRRGRSRGRYIVCRNHQEAEKDGADRA